MVAITTATAIWKGVTVAAQIAMALFIGTLYLSSLGWVVLAIGAVVAVGVALYKIGIQLLLKRKSYGHG